MCANTENNYLLRTQMLLTWNDGLDNYKQHTHIINPDSGIHYFNTTLLDAPCINYTSIKDYCIDILSNKATHFVDVLYSGGLDSELVVMLCLITGIPVRAITMRLIINGYPINTHDLYYSEKFCRENNVTQILIDLNVEDFFSNGKHIEYLQPYLITEPHVATHFWLFEQCSGFPVLGGEYTWPWIHKPLLSPHRHHYSYYDKFLKDKNMFGIGNFMNHSLSANTFLIKAHLDTLRRTHIETNSKCIPIFKQKLWRELKLPIPNIRLRSYGWENLSPAIFNMQEYRSGLLKQFGTTYSSITWNKTLTDIIGGTDNTNDRYY